MCPATARAVPGVLVRFLDRATVALAATCDPELAPRLHWVSGWRIDDDGRSLWCLVPREFADGLEPGARIAVTLEQIGPHECYQFKGRILERRPSNDDDRATVARCRERFAEAVLAFSPMFAGHGDALRAYILEAAVAVRVGVQEIFLQTPGPGAGSLLARLEDPR